MKHTPVKTTDRYTGVEVEQLTSLACNNASLYFTDRYWIDEESLLFRSDASGSTEIWRLYVKTGTSEQITNTGARSEINGDLSPDHTRFAFGYGGAIHVTSLDSPGRLICSFRPPEGWEFIPQATYDADGEHVYAIASRPAGSTTGLQYQKSPEYLERFKSHPSRVYRLGIADGSVTLLYETDMHLQHVNASPTRPGLVTFCHEGPWPQVPQRVWLLDGSGSDPVPVRPQRGDIAIGHEQWLDDGHTVGYHGRTLPDQDQHVWGWCDVDTGEYVEYTFLPHSSHAHARNRRLAVLDGTPANLQPWFKRPWMDPYVFLLHVSDSAPAGEIRVLCEHRSTFNASHPHPQLTPDGGSIIFASDVSGYSQLYRVRVPDLQGLPEEFPTTQWHTAV